MRTRSFLKAVEHQGIAVHLDRPIGSCREGTGPDGQPYRVEYTCDYGYLPGAMGDDGEAYDAYVGSSAHAASVYVIRQLKAGSDAYDEQKAMLGFDSAQHAEAVYRAHVHPSMFGGIASGSLADFKTALGAYRAAGADTPFRWEPAEPAPPSSQRPLGAQDKTMETIAHAANAHAAPSIAHPATRSTPDEGAPVPRPRGLCVRAAELSAVREDGREIDFIMSTGVRDSYGEIVRQNWDLKRFEGNPVALWSHDSKGLPVGQWLNVRVEDGVLKGTLKVATAKANPLAENVWQSILEKTLRAVSVGFMPHKVSFEEIDGEEVCVLDENELYECSPTPIPANPEALIAMRAKAHAEFLARRSAPGVTPVQPTEQRGAVAYEATPPKDLGKWDAAATVRRLRKWASSDGGGDAKHIDWTKYRKAFAWFDPKRTHEFGGFKLPHHDISDGKLVTSRSGVIAAGDAIQGSRGGVKLPPEDMAAVKSHLAKHYRQFDMTPPWEADKTTTSPERALNPKGTSMDPKNKDDDMDEMGMVTCPHCGEAFNADEKAKSMIRGIIAKAGAAEREKHLAALTEERAKTSALQKRTLELELMPLNGVKFAPDELDGHVALGTLWAERGDAGKERWAKHMKGLESRPSLATSPGLGSVLPVEKGAPRLGAPTDGDDVLAEIETLSKQTPAALTA